MSALSLRRAQSCWRCFEQCSGGFLERDADFLGGTISLECHIPRLCSPPLDCITLRSLPSFFCPNHAKIAMSVMMTAVDIAY